MGNSRLWGCLNPSGSGEGVKNPTDSIIAILVGVWLAKSCCLLLICC